MASVSFIKELRPCLVYGKGKEITEPNKALFHLWEQSSRSLLASGISGGVESTVFGIVELEGGTVMRVAPYQIQFVDNKIQEYCFIPEGSSPTGKSELFAVVDGKECYVVRDDFGRIVVTDELMRELIDRAYGSSAKEASNG